jgi:phospholipid/cholesterol/gamma-HCH transport system substrate-binding protein
MNLSRRIKLQLAVFAVVSAVAAAFLFLGYVKLPAMFGVGRYKVTVELARAAGLYPAGNVLYAGTTVGRVESVGLTDSGHVAAVLSLEDGAKIPSDLVAEVHSFSALGEQFLSLVPRNTKSAPLKNGDVIPMKDTTVPVDTDTLLDDTTRSLNAIPHDSLKTAVDESYIAFGGLGPELSRLVNGTTQLAIDARSHLDDLTTLIDQSGPLLNSQVDSGSDIQAWAAHVADITGGLRDNDAAVAGVLDKGAAAADEGRQLIERVKPTLPVLLANLVSVNKVLVTYHAGVEQLLVLIPQAIAQIGATVVPNLNNPHPLAAGFLDFNSNINVPPPCVTGYLPASQRRSPAMTDAPERPDGDIYCRIPQDASQDVRGLRNAPCETKPGKRAPTAAMCESDENYVPLNDGNNWKGDPNATTTGQPVPQTPLGTPPQNVPPVPPPALAVAQYDPATGAYIGPDGKVYTQDGLETQQHKDNTWQGMLVPPQ